MTDNNNDIIADRTRIAAIMENSRGTAQPEGCPKTRVVFGPFRRNEPGPPPRFPPGDLEL